MKRRRWDILLTLMNRLKVIIIFPLIVSAISSCVNSNVVFKPDKQEVKQDKRILQGAESEEPEATAEVEQPQEEEKEAEAEQIEVKEEAPSESDQVNKRILVVSQDGSGDYRKIQDALDRSQPGDTIQVKDGVYVERVDFNRSGTRELPIALINYPDHSPVIDPGGGSYPVDCCPSGGTPRVEFNAEWIILEGFEIRYGWDGVKLYQGHNTVRNNWIHHNLYQGILVVSTGEVLMAGNVIEYNGTDPNTCVRGDGNPSPKHCHGIYMSDYLCSGPSDITIRSNRISNHGGRGIQWNGNGCDTVMAGTLVENNIIENNSWGMTLYHNVEGSVIRNNTFVLEWNPDTNDSTHAFVGIWNSTGNAFYNNIFFTTRGDVRALIGETASTDQNIFDHNIWRVSEQSWMWNDEWLGDFNSKYEATAGDSYSDATSANPGFMDLENGDYHLTSTSDAKDSGNDEECSRMDYDYESRGQDGSCDIGAFEFNEF